jgi:hypothetical protein
MTGVGMCGVFIPDRFRQASRGANGKMEPIEGSETSAIGTQTPGKHPKENILHIKQEGESLKSTSPVFVIIYVYQHGPR